MFCPCVLVEIPVPKIPALRAGTQNPTGFLFGYSRGTVRGGCGTLLQLRYLKNFLSFFSLYYIKGFYVLRISNFSFGSSNIFINQKYFLERQQNWSCTVLTKDECAWVITAKKLYQFIFFFEIRLDVNSFFQYLKHTCGCFATSYVHFYYWNQCLVLLFILLYTGRLFQ